MNLINNKGKVWDSDIATSDKQLITYDGSNLLHSKYFWKVTVYDNA